MDLVWLFTIGQRVQPDKPGKKRTVYSFLRGWVETDITPPDPWASADPRWRRCRNRVINVAPMSSFPLRALARCWKKHMDRTIPFATIHPTPAAVASKLSTFKSSRFFDVENHDNNIPVDLIRILAETISRKLGPVWAALLLLTMRQPQLSRPDEPGVGGHRLEGDPFDIDTFKAWYVNPSGMPPTSEVARLAGICYQVDALVQAGEVELSREAFLVLLTGQHRHWGFLNAGDNLALGGPDDKAIMAANEAIDYVTIGEADSFLGWIPFRAATGELVMEPSPVSYVTNLVNRGRSADDPQSGDPLAGAPSRRAYYSAARAFKRVDDILCTTMADCTGIDYRRADLPTSAVRISNNIVAQILAEKPDAIYYAVDKDDVPQELLDEVFITVPESQMAQLVAGVTAAGRQPGWDGLVKRLLMD